MAAAPAIVASGSARSLRWDDLPPAVQRRLSAAGVDRASFPAFQLALERRTLARVRESDLDALVYYALQSTAFTQEPPIEPALSARAFVEGLDTETRAQFLSGRASPIDRVPATARRRLAAFIGALRKPQAGSRLAFFSAVVRREARGPTALEPFLREQYVRAARFLYEKEFVAPQRADRVDAIARLYHDRGLSTDTAVEAGYLVHVGLSTLKALEPTRQIYRVLIVGPGFDLAPRTGLLEVAPPESYQPFAIVDALVSAGLATLGDVTVIGADVNPGVVDHLQAVKNRDVLLTLVTGVGGETVTLQDDYRAYFNALGRAIGDAAPAPVLPVRYEGHLRKSLRVRREAARAIDAVRLDIATERLDGAAFDLIVATNIFPYLDDVSLTMALANIAAMLAPGGVLIHNEPRPLLVEVTTELGLPLEQARTTVIATVRGVSAPLVDGMFMHAKRAP